MLGPAFVNISVLPFPLKNDNIAENTGQTPF